MEVVLSCGKALSQQSFVFWRYVRRVLGSLVRQRETQKQVVPPINGKETTNTLITDIHPSSEMAKERQRFFSKSKIVGHSITGGGGQSPLTIINGRVVELSQHLTSILWAHVVLSGGLEL